MRAIGTAQAVTPLDESSGSASHVVMPSREALYERHFDFVWRNARRMGVREEDIDDAVQEVFIVAFRRYDEFEARSSIETWLFGILFRTVQHYRRAKARRLNKMEALELDAGAEPHTAEGPHDELDRRRQAEALHRLLDELDDDKRATFVLVELEERTVPEVAEVLGVNVNTVYSRLRAAREELKGAIWRMQLREARMGKP